MSPTPASPQPAPRVDETGVPWCVDTCPCFSGSDDCAVDVGASVNPDGDVCRVAVRALAAERNELRARVLACPACGESFAHPDDHALRYPDIHEPEAARWNVNCEVQRTARGGWTVGCPNLEVALRTGAVGRDLGLGASRIFSNGDSSCDRHLVSWPDADALLAPAVPTRAADLATLSSAVDLAVTATAGEPDHADLKAGWEAALARLAEAVR